MSDHVDGPRSIGEPAGDVSDLFAFTSPENPARTVLAACVFPSAGEDAVFSNVIEYSIVVRHVTLAGVGNDARFEPASAEIRFTFKFDLLQRDAAGQVIQRGKCTLPDGRKVALTVNDERGASTPEGDVRVFAGLRSDPFYLAWTIHDFRPVPNLLQHDNVLSLVVDVDTRRVLDSAGGSLFGAIAETVPAPQSLGRIGHPVARIDWIGRPEQTNIRLNNPGVPGDDLRDLWNQQTPFAIAKELQPLFVQRLRDSFANYDLRDDRVIDWPPEALAANVNVFLDDFLVFDVAKPITDESHLEIEKSTINGHPYQTGGGRTIDANCIDILLTWLVNRDRKFLQGGATQATKRAMQVFPYLATPNTELQTVAESVKLEATADTVWSVIGRFNIDWHPLVARVSLAGTGIGQLRIIGTIDGNDIVERLDAVDNTKRFYRYTLIAGTPASHYGGMLEVTPEGGGCVVSWSVEFLANNKPDIEVRTSISTLLRVGLGSLKARFGATTTASPAAALSR